MKWSFRICEIRGTQVRVHLTFFILPALIGFGLLTSEGPLAALTGVAFILALFTCVVLHEFGHATAAKYYGIRTPDITLLPIGGVARLERIPRKPFQELVIAISGPLVNVFIAAMLILILRQFPGSLWIDDIGNPGLIPMNLLKINLMLIVFNLVPAFPMDGGRMLRAILAMFMDYDRATQTAVSLGQMLAIIGGLFGLLNAHLFLVIIAIFIFMAGGQEAAFSRIREATKGLSVSDAMITKFRTLPAHASLNDAVDALIAGSQHDLPILDETGKVEGVLLRKDLIAALAEHGRTHPIRDIVKEKPPSVSLDYSLEAAFEILSASPCPTLPVMDSSGENLVGILTAENVGEMIMVQSALSSRKKTKGKSGEPTVA